MIFIRFVKLVIIQSILKKLHIHLWYAKDSFIFYTFRTPEKFE